MRERKKAKCNLIESRGVNFVYLIRPDPKGLARQERELERRNQLSHCKRKVAVGISSWRTRMLMTDE